MVREKIAKENKSEIIQADFSRPNFIRRCGDDVPVFLASLFMRNFQLLLPNDVLKAVRLTQTLNLIIEF